jgi:hypothetical protein
VTAEFDPPQMAPRLVIAGSASAAETAAITAAIESFAQDTAPARTRREGAGSGSSDAWARAAILEGVERAGRAIQGDLPDPWINT